MRSMLVVLAAIAATVIAGVVRPLPIPTRRAPDARRASALRLDASQAITGHYRPRCTWCRCAAKPAITYHRADSRRILEDRTGQGRALQLAPAGGAAVLGSPHRAAGTRCCGRSAPATARLCSYTHALNGFAAKADALRGGAAPERQVRVARVGGSGPDARREQLSPPQFLGAPERDRGGLRGRWAACAALGIIIGVIDTGRRAGASELRRHGRGPADQLERRLPGRRGLGR